MSRVEIGTHVVHHGATPEHNSQVEIRIDEKGNKWFDTLVAGKYSIIITCTSYSR